MGSKYSVLFLDSVKSFIQKLPKEDQGKISASITVMESGDFKSIYVKTLRTPIKELIVKKYRLVFFFHKNTVYFIGAFVKKTTKTPKMEIENAERVFEKIVRNYK